MKRMLSLAVATAMTVLTAFPSAVYGESSEIATIKETAENYNTSEISGSTETVYTENLSFFGEIIADSVYEDHAAANANDGDYSTFWQSGSKGNGDGNAWIGLDMNDIAVMNCLTVSWTNSYPSTDGLYVEISDDCVNWTRASCSFERDENFTGSVPKVTDHIYLAEPTETRAIRVVCHKMFTDENGNTKEHPTVAELWVFGSTRKYATVTEQPADAAAKYGEIAHTSVEATGDGRTYQWYYKNAGMKAFKKSSVTDSTYSCRMSESKSGRQVYCVITDKYGNSVKSDTATLRMTLSLLKHPESVDTAIGEVVCVKAVARGDGLTYQWYVKEPGKYYFSRSSVKSATYSYTMTTAKANRQVYCVVTDKYGDYTVTDVATLYAKVRITKQPTDGFAQNGKTAQTCVKAAGEELTYQWYYKNASMKAFARSSVTDSNYFCTMSESKHGRQVYCVVTDKFGNSVRSDTVTLGLTAYIVKQPQSTGVNLGEEVSVAAVALGEGLKYQWFVKNKGDESFVASSVTKSSYSYTMTRAKSGRQVYCVITDEYGNSVTTDTVTLYAKLTVTKQPVNITAENGETGETAVKAVGEGLTYQWYYKNASMQAFARSSATTATYSCVMTESKNGRQVYCVITDKFGNAVTSDVATLKIS